MTRKSNVPAKIVPTSVPSLKKEGEVKIFTKPQLDFLRAYSQCYDEDQAFTEARIEKRHRSDILNEPHVKEEMQKIQRVWQFHGRMTAGFAAGNHMRLMSRFESEFDGSESHGDRAKFAGTLAKMSEASLKSTGLIGNQQSDQVPTVIINMTDSSATANVQVNVEKKHEQ